MTERTMVLSVHRLRRTARKRERELQELLHRYEPTMGAFNREALPPWTRGVRVEKAGLLQWAVVATSRKGH